MKSPELALESFDHIELTPEEEAEALRVAKEAKHYAQKKAAYFKSLDAPVDIFKPTWEQWAKAFTEQLQVDASNKNVINNLCHYFAGDGTWGDVKKGLLVVGGVGVGKTTIMRFFQRNPVQSYRIISARKIENEYSSADKEEGGEVAIEKYSTDRSIAVNSDIFGHKSLALCIDDLGTESEGKHYGKDRNVIGEIILNRYDANLVTHITANTTAAEIAKVYGDRVADRLREMVNLVEFPIEAKSRRK